MRKAKYRFFLTGLIATAMFILTTPIFSQTTEEYLDIDLTNVTIGETRGVEPVPWHMSIELTTGLHYMSILTLDHRNGAQKGSSLRLAIPTDDQTPAAILWSKHFTADFTRGVEPSPWIVYRDYIIRYFPLHFELDGTPTQAGPWSTIIPAAGPDLYGYATCMAELPGSEFSDGKPRLYIGTEGGCVLILVNTYAAGLIIEGVFCYSDGPIDDLEPIPQYGYIALGALINNRIYGLDHRTKRDGDDRYFYNFMLYDPRTPPITGFDVIGPNDAQLPGNDSRIGIILANGTNELGITSISGMESGNVILNITPDIRQESIRKVASGSLLILPADGSTILYDPHFSEETGSSGCGVDIIDPEPDYCYGLCGDVDNNGAVNILDIVYLINYKYKSGPEPYIMNLGNVDGIDPVNILDIVYLINYRYKSGPEPDCP